MCVQASKPLHLIIVNPSLLVPIFAFYFICFPTRPQLTITFTRPSSFFRLSSFPFFVSLERVVYLLCNYYMMAVPDANHRRALVLEKHSWASYLMLALGKRRLYLLALPFLLLSIPLSSSIFPVTDQIDRRHATLSAPLYSLSLTFPIEAHRHTHRILYM